MVQTHNSMFSEEIRELIILTRIKLKCYTLLYTYNTNVSHDLIHSKVSEHIFFRWTLGLKFISFIDPRDSLTRTIIFSRAQRSEA